jgi:hypothetical protein
MLIFVKRNQLNHETMKTKRIKERLEELRIEIQNERISIGEIIELQSLVEHIDKSDVELLQWAGVDEFDELVVSIEFTLGYHNINRYNTINDIAISEEIEQDELFEYKIINRESFIDELIGWIAEAQRGGRSDAMVMKEDLNYLFNIEDEYIFSSISTNEYVCKSDDNFNYLCVELLKINNSLK